MLASFVIMLEICLSEFFPAQTLARAKYKIMYLKFVIEDLKIFLCFWISSPFYFFLMSHLFILSFLLLHRQLRIELTLFLFLQGISSFSGKPASCQSLNEEGCFVSPLFPHLSVEVHDRLNDLIVSGVDKEAFFFHLGANLSFTFGRFANPLIGLGFTREAKLMIGPFLISLGIGIPALDIRVDLSIPSNKWLFLIDAYNFDNLCPLFSNITFFISLHHHWLHLIVVIWILLHLRCQYINIAGVVPFRQTCKSISHPPGKKFLKYKLYLFV